MAIKIGSNRNLPSFGPNPCSTCPHTEAGLFMPGIKEAHPCHYTIHGDEEDLRLCRGWELVQEGKLGPPIASMFDRK